MCKRRKIVKILASSLASVCVLALFTTLIVGIDLKAEDNTASITAEIVKAREYTASFVTLAKGNLKGPDLTEAEKLYAAAYSNYSGWDAYVETALRDGKAKKLNTDEKYQKWSDDATSTGTKFVAFVDSKTGQSKAVVAILSSLADLGLKLWNGIK